MDTDDGHETFDPGKCVLERFESMDDKINLYFKNGSQATIKGINVEGAREIDLIESILENFTGSTYEEILAADF
ncbi:MAG: hypothetical protein Q8P74_02100 [bacterium]|nr:hypothetical protein [bacterium]